MGRRESLDDRDRLGVVPLPQRAGELGNAVGAGVRRMQQAHDLVAGDRRFGLGETGRDQPRFARDGQRIERGADQQALGLVHQFRRHADLALEAAREDVARDGVLERRPLGRDPQSAARQLALEIGHHAVRPDHEADQLVDRLHRAGDGAQPLGAGTAFARSGVELVVAVVCGARASIGATVVL